MDPILKIGNLYNYINNNPQSVSDYLGLVSADPLYFDTTRIRTNNIVREFISESYNDAVFYVIHLLQDLTKENTWKLVESDLIDWINGKHMGNTTYNSDDPRTKAIKNSYIGRTARSLFIQKTLMLQYVTNGKV